MKSDNLTDHENLELQRLRNILESAGDGFIMHDLEGKIVDANEALCKTLGYSIEELSALNVTDLYVGEIEYGYDLWNDILVNRSSLLSYGVFKIF